MPRPGRMSRPASRDATTAMVPVIRTGPVRIAALAARTVTRRGIATRVVRIIPVLYSLLMTRTATMAMTTWPREIPVRLILAGSSAQCPDGHVTAAAAAALTVAV